MYQRYDFDSAGSIVGARIVPADVPEPGGDRARPAAVRGSRAWTCDDAELTRQCEQAIRNYDPCISCAAHFLDLTVERSS